MSTFFKLAITALVLNACVQAGRSAWTFYQFEDSVQQAALFSASQTAPQVKARIVELAERAGSADRSRRGRGQLPRAPRRGSPASYTDHVRLMPGGYVYDWTHVLDLDVRRVPY